MRPDKAPRRVPFVLRLSASLRQRVDSLAKRDGVSVNQFISLAIEEKVNHLRAERKDHDHPDA
jgi:predicted HicB family RNase H-like nuclease